MNTNQHSNGNNAGNTEHGTAKKKYVFFIGKQKHETDQPVLTVRQILTEYGKVDAATNTLALKEEGNPKEYTNLDEPITMKEGMHFTIFNNEPTPVS